MARKKGENTLPASETEAGTKAVRLELDLGTHQELRVVAAKAGKSMAAYVRRLIDEDLAKHRMK